MKREAFRKVINIHVYDGFLASIFGHRHANCPSTEFQSLWLNCWAIPQGKNTYQKPTVRQKSLSISYGKEIQRILKKGIDIRQGKPVQLQAKQQNVQCFDDFLNLFHHNSSTNMETLAIATLGSL